MAKVLLLSNILEHYIGMFRVSIITLNHKNTHIRHLVQIMIMTITVSLLGRGRSLCKSCIVTPPGSFRTPLWCVADPAMRVRCLGCKLNKLKMHMSTSSMLRDAPQVQQT